jgi:hypothetical protein
VRRVVVLGPGDSQPFDEAEWRDALVVVRAGEVELEGMSGRRYRLRAGTILWLVGLPLRSLHNRGEHDVVLAAVSRRP